MRRWLDVARLRFAALSLEEQGFRVALTLFAIAAALLIVAAELDRLP